MAAIRHPLVGAFSVIVKSLRTIVWSSTRHLAPRLTPRWSIIAAAIYGGRHTPQPTLVTNNSYTQSLCRQTLSPHSPSRFHTSNADTCEKCLSRIRRKMVRWTRNTNNEKHNVDGPAWQRRSRKHMGSFSASISLFTQPQQVPVFAPEWHPWHLKWTPHQQSTDKSKYI